MPDLKSIPTNPVKSSNILEVGYDAEAKVLVVLFQGGAKYAYKEVPSTVYDEMMSAPSIGSYWFKQKSKYEYEKV